MLRFLNRRGAMFGLDARITLGIFGLLSAVAGVATYAAVSNARETAQLQTIKSITQAVEAYMNDTKLSPTSFDDFLINPSIAGWSGPYLKGNFRNEGGGVWTTNGVMFVVGRASTADGTTATDCSDTNDCYTTLNIYAPYGTLTSLDRMYDGDDSPSTGVVRTQDNDGSWIAYMILKTAKAHYEDDGEIELPGGGEVGHVEF